MSYCGNVQNKRILIPYGVFSIYGQPAPTYPAGVLPDPSPALKRRGSAYRSKKKTKDNSKPYPKRKGSFRRFAGGEDDD